MRPFCHRSSPVIQSGSGPWVVRFCETARSNLFRRCSVGLRLTKREQRSWAIAQNRRTIGFTAGCPLNPIVLATRSRSLTVIAFAEPTVAPSGLVRSPTFSHHDEATPSRFGTPSPPQGSEQRLCPWSRRWARTLDCRPAMSGTAPASPDRRGQQGSRSVLVRLDGYIGYRCEPASADALLEDLGQFLVRKNETDRWSGSRFRACAYRAFAEERLPALFLEALHAPPTDAPYADPTQRPSIRASRSLEFTAQLGKRPLSWYYGPLS